MSWAVAILALACTAALVGLAAALRRLRAARRECSAELARGQRVQLLEALLAAVPVPILVVDREGRCLEQFPAGDDRDGSATLAQMPAQARAELEACLESVVETGQRKELRFSRDEHWYVADVLALASTPGSAKAAAVIIRDVTAQQESATRLSRLAARNDAILRSAMDGFFIADDEHRFLEVNEAFCLMTGYSAAELLRMKVPDLEVPVSHQTCALPRTRTGLHQFATAHRHKDGHIIQLENSVIVLRDNGRKILVGFARDVTERCRAEQALLESEERYRSLFEQSRDAIYMSSRDGKLVDVNQAALALFGYNKRELIGRNVCDLYVSPADRERFQREIERKRAVQDYPVLLKRKAGTEMHCLLTATVRAASDGSILGYQGIIRDITARRRAEQAVRESEARYRAIVEAFDGFIYICSEDRRLEFVSEKLIRHLGSDPTGQPCYRALHARESACAWCTRDQVAQGRTARCEVKSPKDNRWYYMVSTPIRHTDGTLSTMSMLLDVTERKQAEEERRKLQTQMQHSQRLESLGMLAGGVAHDFNNFLVGILGNASLALEKLSGSAAAARPHLQKIVKVSQRASELTRQMLAYSGRASYDVRPTNLNELVEEMGEFMRAAVPKTVELAIKLQSDLPTIEADSGQIQQVIMNLLINAAEAIGNRAGHVTVTTFTRTLGDPEIAAYPADHHLVPGEYVCLEVSDSGCGMSPETQERIFDPFFTTKFAGRGLGLAAILGIVRGHRGAVKVNSRPGRGTVFTVVFPASAVRLRASAAVPPAGRLPAGATVLVIDDEEDIRDIVQSVLERHGARVLLAGDGAGGIELFKRHADEIDLVLLDMTMPGMSGAEVFGEIVSLRPETRVVLSSGYSEQEVSTHFSNGQLAGFIQKPYTVDTLVQKVGASLLRR